MNNMAKDLQIVTFGCRLNIYESEVIKKSLESADVSNTIVINSCAVTAEAERQVRQSIRKLHKANPNAKIVVTGCSAQINSQVYENMPEVSLVLGNEEKLNPNNYRFDGGQKVILSDIMQVQETASHLVSGFEGKARAFVQVQNGCNHRCTFCIIPFARGNSRSVPIGEIVTQVNLLLDQGYSEIVLTGVDLTAYGEDLPGKPTLGAMTRRLLNLAPDLKRLRLSSLDPSEIDDDLWSLIGDEPRLMPHLHLSLQAGDDLTLKRMKRRHLRLDAISFCQKAKILRPDVVFGADIIAGFPTETDTMFETSLQTIQECGITYYHVFPYSPRPGTPAAKMPQVDKQIIKRRAALLRTQGQQALHNYFQSIQGTIQNVLIENVSASNKASQEFTYFGKTDHFAPVHLNHIEKFDIGHVCKVKITSIDQDQLTGEII